MILRKDIADLIPFEAGDGTWLREVFHPKNETLPIEYSLAHASIAPSGKSIPHQLEQQSELFVFLSGKGIIYVGTDATEVKAGTAVLVPAGERQWIENPGEEALVFLCIVNPPWRKEDEVILED